MEENRIRGKKWGGRGKRENEKKGNRGKERRKKGKKGERGGEKERGIGDRDT